MLHHNVTMNTRVHMCSVERQLEPNLAEKLVTLCTRLEALVKAASSLNDNTRCTVEGTYLATTMVKIDGYYHVNDEVLQDAIEECELAFGSNTSTCLTDTTQNLIMLECQFKDRQYSCWLTVTKLFGFVLLLCACWCLCNELQPYKVHMHNILSELFINSTNYTEL